MCSCRDWHQAAGTTTASCWEMPSAPPAARARPRHTVTCPQRIESALHPACESMTLRAASLNGQASCPRWDALQVYRRLRWGRLAHIHLLDSRQYRTWQACRTPQSTSAGAVRAADCADLASPARTLLGAMQEQWLDTGLAADAHTEDATHWSVLAQQTLFSPRHYPSGVTSADSWDGYPAARARLLQAVAQHAPRNTVLLGGDIHQNYVCRVHANPDRPESPVVASEFCGTSISSRSGTTQDKVDAIARHNPHVLLDVPQN